MRVPWSPPVDLVIRMTVTIPNPGLGKEEDGCKVCLLLAPPPLLEDSAFARSGGLSGQDTFRQVRSQASGVVGQVTSDTLSKYVASIVKYCGATPGATPQ